MSHGTGALSFRDEVKAAAKRFRSTWVELGALLIKVRREGLYKEWDYDNFEDYCLKELNIKRQTALKLTNSYAFLEKHERELLNQPIDKRPTPEFEVVEVLAKAEERGQLTEKAYQAIRDDIWKKEAPANEVARELSQKFPAPAPPPKPVEFQLKRFAATARRFATELKANHEVPKAIKERADALADDLEELAANHQAA